MDERLGGDLARLRQLNALNVLRALRGRSPQTVSELVTRTGLSRPSCEDLLGLLVEQGWGAIEPPAPGGLGRPARRYRFRAENGCVLGLDIGAYHVRAALSDLEGTVLATAARHVEPELPYPERFAAADSAARDCLRAAGLTTADLWAATAGTTGIVDRSGGIVLSAAIGDWAGAPLVAHLRATYPCPVLVENDSKLAALAEHRKGAAQDVRDLVFLHAGRRTGASLILNGRLYHGHSGATGEIGSLATSRWGDAARTLLACPIVPPGTPAEEVGVYVFAAARAGDPTAEAAVRRYAKDLAQGAAAMILTLDPTLVVLGGGFSRSGDVLIGPLRQALSRLVVRPPILAVSTLGADAVTTGALCHCVDHLSRMLFSTTSVGLPPPKAPLRG